MKLLGTMTIAIGALFAYGSIGAYDCANIEFTQFAIQFAIALGITLAGAYMTKR